MRAQFVSAPKLNEIKRILRFYVIGSAGVGAVAFAASSSSLTAPFDVLVALVVAFGLALVETRRDAKPKSRSQSQGWSFISALHVFLWSTTIATRSILRPAGPTLAIAVLFAYVATGDRWLTNALTYVPSGDAFGIFGSLIGIFATAWLALWGFRERERLATARHRTFATRYLVSRFSDFLPGQLDVLDEHELPSKLPKILHPLSDRRFWGRNVVIKYRSVEKHKWSMVEGQSNDFKTFLHAAECSALESRGLVYAPRTDLNAVLLCGDDSRELETLSWHPIGFSSTHSPRSILCIPLLKGDKAIGVLTISSQEPNAFAPPDFGFAECIADALRESFEIRARLLLTAPVFQAKLERHDFNTPPFSRFGAIAWPWALAKSGLEHLLRFARAGGV